MKENHKRAERLPVIDSIRMFQEASGHLSNMIAPDEEPVHVLGHLREELEELEASVAEGGRRDVGSELPDIVILAFRLADMYGIDMAEAMTRKLERNGHKYMGYVKGLIENGVDPTDARRMAKESWDKNRDHEFDIM